MEWQVLQKSWIMRWMMYKSQVEVTEINCNNAWIYWGGAKWVGNDFGWLLVLNGRKTRSINPEKQKFNSRQWCKWRVIALKVMELCQGKAGGKSRPNYICSWNEISILFASICSAVRAQRRASLWEPPTPLGKAQKTGEEKQKFVLSRTERGTEAGKKPKC